MPSAKTNYFSRVKEQQGVTDGILLGSASGGGGKCGAGACTAADANALPWGAPGIAGRLLLHTPVLMGCTPNQETGIVPGHQ